MADALLVQTIRDLASKRFVTPEISAHVEPEPGLGPKAAISVSLKGVIPGEWTFRDDASLSIIPLANPGLPLEKTFLGSLLRITYDRRLVVQAPDHLVITYRASNSRTGDQTSDRIVLYHALRRMETS